MKTSTPTDGSPGVFYPGERSNLGKIRREKEGVDIPQFIWDRILNHAREFGISDTLVPKALGPGASDHIKPASDQGSKLIMQAAQEK